MVPFAERVGGPDIRRPGAGLVEGGPLGWAARDSAKPGRSAEADCWVLQATPAWSAAHLEAEREAIVPAFLTALAEAGADPLPQALTATAHRWRYAKSRRHRRPHRPLRLAPRPGARRLRRLAQRPPSRERVAVGAGVRALLLR